MRLITAVLAVASSIAVRAAPIESHPFTVNLLTDVADLSMTSPGALVSVTFDNATAKHVYNDHLYSIVGSLVFTDTDTIQTYEVHTVEWNKTVDITIEDNVGKSHIDISVSKTEGDDKSIRFDPLSEWDVKFKNEPRDA